MNHADLEAIDPDFVDDLAESDACSLHVAAWLRSCGKECSVPPQRVRPNVAERMQYSDCGDIYVRQRIEAKHRHNITFTNASDFPYPTIIVDVVELFERKWPVPYAYVIANAPLTHAAIVLVSTKPDWTRGMAHDSNCGRAREYYYCPVKRATFVSIELPR